MGYSFSYLCSICPYSSSDSSSVPEEEKVSRQLYGVIVRFKKLVYTYNVGRKVTWTLKSMFVRTGRWWSGCGGLKLFPSGAFGWSLSPCINCRNARSCKGMKWISSKSFLHLYIFIFSFTRMKSPQYYWENVEIARRRLHGNWFFCYLAMDF